VISRGTKSIRCFSRRFNSETPMNQQERYGHRSVEYNGHIYVIGGAGVKSDS